MARCGPWLTVCQLLFNDIVPVLPAKTFFPSHLQIPFHSPMKIPCSPGKASFPSEVILCLFLSATPNLWLDPQQGTWCSQLWLLLFCELTRLCFSVILLVCLLVIRFCTNFTPASLRYTMPSTQATLSRHVCNDKNLFLASCQNPPTVLIMKSN